MNIFKAPVAKSLWVFALFVATDHVMVKEVESYSHKIHTLTRRTCIQAVCASFVVSNPRVSNAKAPTVTNPLESLVEAQETLETLLTNYKKATVDCTFADVPRELLETKNKELLLEKAATNALFDKSASIETCKTTNRIVRDYLGVTGKGTYTAEKHLMTYKMKQIRSAALLINVTLFC